MKNYAMNYRHAYHAGSFTDVFKHILLARMVEYLKRKDKAFRVFDTHAGIGRYDLASEEAAKTGEYALGAGRVLAASPPSAILKIIGPWLDTVRAEGDGFYPGSPRVARHLLRKQDRLSLYELHEEDSQALSALFAGDYQARVNRLDGWLVAGAHVPPKESRGLLLIDPPFEDGGDFDRMIDSLEKCRRRWTGGTVALWYPVKKREHTDEWLGTLKDLKFPDMLNAELYIREPRSASMLNGCGMVIVNPPFTLADELRTLLPWLAETMRQDKGAGHQIQNLSG